MQVQEDKNAMRFPQKLWYLLNLRTDAIMWGGTGRTILMNYRTLHNYLQCDYSIFKTTNISSFVRQLNLYGFRKVTSHLQDPLCNSSNPYMHEYVHDCFQYGRPELLNKITRKALTIKRHLRKPQILLLETESSTEQNMTPLQRARNAFQKALQKTTQDLLIQHYLQKLENHNETTVHRTEESIQHDWIVPDKDHPQPEILVNGLTQTNVEDTNDSDMTENDNDSAQFNDEASNDIQVTEINGEANNVIQNTEETTNYGDFSSQEMLNPFMNFQDDSTVELLAEFNIEHDIDQGITRRIEDKSTSMNCVLPSIENDAIYNVSMERRNLSDIVGEWDQMLDDIIINREPSSETSDLKELYSQISRTIDLLNS